MNLLFDIGGTKTRFAISRDGNSFEEPVIFETQKNFDAAMREYKSRVDTLVTGEKIEKSVGGIRRLNAEKNAILPDFRLPDWSEKPLKKKLSEVTGGEVFLENDTALVGLGEAVAGAGKDKNIVVYMTISTGVGGVRIVNKKIDENVFGFEPGHQIIDADWTMMPEIREYATTEKLGQLEAYISGTSIEQRYGKKPYEIEDPKIWDEVAKILSYGITNTILHCSPDVVILGGGMMKSPGITIEEVRNHLQENLSIISLIPEVKKADLGDIGGLHGALAHLKDI